MRSTHSHFTVLVLCLVYLLPVQCLWGQAKFRYLNKRHGLSQISVLSIAQDSTGFLWFGTRDGLNKYDGHRFQIYREGVGRAGLRGNDIRTLYVDPLTKALWVGTLSGLNRYDAVRDTFTTYRASDNPDGLRDNVIRTIYRDGGGTLWVGTLFGLHRYDSVADEFRRVASLGSRDEDLKVEVKFIAESTTGVLFLGTSAGLIKSDGIPATTWELVPELAGLDLTCGRFDGRGNLWAGTATGGLIKWDPVGQQKTTFTYDATDPYSLSDDRVRTLAIDGKGNLWVGTFGGLNLLPPEGKKFTRFLDRNAGDGSLRHNSVRSLLVDRLDNLWVGTYYGGVHHLDDRYNFFTNYRQEPYRNSLSANVVSSFAQDGAGDLWIGTEGGGLNRFQPDVGRFTRYRWRTGADSSAAGDNIKTLLYDEGYLWIGAYQGGLTRLDPATGQSIHFGKGAKTGPGLSHENVYGLHRSGDYLWILTYGGGLNLLQLKTNEIRHYRRRIDEDNSIGSDNTRTLMTTAANTVWIGTNLGLTMVKTDAAGLPVRFTSVLPDENVYALAPAREGFWVGTFSGGLLHCDAAGRIIRRYTMDDGLPDNSVFGILETTEGILWLSTGNGLSRFDPTRKQFNNFDATNGLETLEFNFNAAYRSREGNFYYGGNNGFTTFDPRAFSPNQNVPPVVFTRLLRNNQEVTIRGASGLLDQSINETTALSFPYGGADFTLEFAALDFFSPQNNQYAYKLAGLDRDWKFTQGETRASYNIQREGEYTFLLRGGNGDGAWNPEVRELRIEVLPPPWRTWWAYTLYFVLTGLVLFALLRFQRLRHRVQLQEAAKRQQDELIEMKLRFFTNITHEFRTPLTLILGPLEQLVNKTDPREETGRQLGRIHRNARRLLNLVNQILTFRKLDSDHEPLRIAEYSLVEFTTDIFDAFTGVAESRTITYRLIDESGGVRPWFDAAKLEKVLFNLLSNAFKFTPDGGTITVWLHQHEDKVSLRVKDSGVGIAPEIREEIFKRFYEKSAGKQSDIKSTGIGLAVSRELVALHGGKISVADGDGRGAEFVVELPLGRSHFSERDLTQVSGGLPERTGREYATADYPTERKAVANSTLLLVDDNAEIREYVASIFREQYRILQAATGTEGLEVARTAAPTLIISDVMMPEMDGLEFCHRLKNDLSISHIPVVLLTAKSGQPLRLQGLRTGADDYVTKPFHPEELQLRVTNLLRNRQRFRESFSRVLRLEPDRVAVPSLDEAFLRQALAIAEQQVRNPDYKVEDFARDLAVSRTLLFNKLKSLTGQTPSKFLKTFRLQRAAQLLTDSDYRIGKIAGLVGFRDQRYFADAFRARYGISPREYRKQGVAEA